MSNTINVSVDDKSNIVIGQVLVLNIVFKSDSNIPVNSKFELKNLMNATASNICFSIKNSDNYHSVTTELHIDKNLRTGDVVSFDIVPNAHAVGFSTKTINYTAHEVDLDSLGIYFEEDVIPALMTDEVNIPPTGKSYTRAIAMVKNRNGYPLSEVPITIIGGYLPNLDKVKIFLSNQDPNTEVSKQSLYGEQSIVLNTDKNGKLEFYIYLSDKSQFVLDLKARVSGKTGFVFSRNKLYVIDDDSGAPYNIAKQTLNSPNILDYSGELRGNDSSSTFLVSIDSYNNAKEDDTILFYVDGKYSQQKIVVNDIKNLNNYFIHLPYTIFPLNKFVIFSYVVVSINGNIQSSAGSYVQYVGGGKNQPLDNVTRVYDMCTVYSSFGPSIPSNLVFKDDIVNYFTISRYMNNKEHDGLFVVITGTNDPTDKTKVPFGSEVTLSFRIDSYKKQVYKTFTKTMPTQPDQGSKNTATLIFGISYEDVSHVESDSNSVAGRIYFDYQINELGKITYGKIWEARIDTARPSPYGDTDEGDSN
ncbi:hypothetical protein [Xenorhabdus bovienii]|uniref:hypothetical protein n=1 Tax=Xenorhabdus bovienii TaxID=40576 RepID=UPI0004D5B032|nr:hypothetical protein [Xenorhabdus bovienii]CDG88188.1 hypothetical protein XBFFR1_2050002 [Xenorhabdus bovienii str. feltiae France]CDG92469.1 hypothetical protein XBFFL1_2170111 [Xenorhabdus bovienii str. feltiae Florida]